MSETPHAVMLVNVMFLSLFVFLITDYFHSMHAQEQKQTQKATEGPRTHLRASS